MNVMPAVRFDGGPQQKNARSLVGPPIGRLRPEVASRSACVPRFEAPNIAEPDGSGQTALADIAAAHRRRVLVGERVSALHVHAMSTPR